MTRILHLSDTHFGTEVPEVVRALEIHLQEMPADLLIISGDITQRARRAQFAAAATFVQRLQQNGLAHTLIVPGNHDLPLFNLIQRFCRPYRHYQEYFGHDLEPCFENDDVLIIGLNTTHPRRHKNGRVSPQQIQAVSQRLKACSPTKRRFVVAHQPFGAMVSSDLENLQQGAEPALKAWAEAGLDAVIGGHIHLPYIRPLTQQYPELGREIWAVQAGTATSTRLRRAIPNSFNRLHIVHADNSRQILAERWDYQAGQFSLGTCLTLD